jgi:hypothetical protein
MSMMGNFPSKSSSRKMFHCSTALWADYPYSTQYSQQWCNEGGWGFKHPPTLNFEVLTKLSRIPSSVENMFVTTYQEYGFHPVVNWVEPLTRGLTPPHHLSICPLSSTEFVDPPKKFLGKPLTFNKKHTEKYGTCIAAVMCGMCVQRSDYSSMFGERAVRSQTYSDESKLRRLLTQIPYCLKEQHNAKQYQIVAFVIFLSAII